MIELKATAFVLLCLIMMSCPASAQELFQYEVIAEIQQDLSVSYQEKFIFSDSAFDSFVIPIEGSPETISVDSPVECVQAQKYWGTEVSCDTSGKSEESFSIRVSYVLRDRVEGFDSKYIFRDSIRAQLAAKNMIVILKVPEGMGLIEKYGESVFEQPFLPTTGFVGSDGRRPIITWEKGPLAIGEGIDASVVFEPIVVGIYDERATMLLAALIAIVIALGAYYRFYWRKKTSVKVVLPILKQDEKLVMEALMKHGGKDVNQKLIVGDSNYSKAKVSKVLKNLQERGIITLERIGRKNKVSLVREFKKEEQKSSGNN